MHWLDCKVGDWIGGWKTKICTTCINCGSPEKTKTGYVEVWSLFMLVARVHCNMCYSLLILNLGIKMKVLLFQIVVNVLDLIFYLGRFKFKTFEQHSLYCMLVWFLQLFIQGTCSNAGKYTDDNKRLWKALESKSYVHG